MLSRPAQTRSEHALLETIDSTIRAACLSKGFVEQWYPTLIDRHSLDDAGYREAFPHLLCDVAIGDQASSWCLSPAVCYHTFIALRGACLAPQTKITARNHCYRNEQEIIPGRRQIEFEMRELVVVGSESWIEDQLVRWEQQIGMVARRFGIVASWKAAADPFFLPTAKGKALMQRLLKTKQEYCLSDGLAIASINRHRDYFANRFSIRTVTGLPVHSACIAFGLDRWMCAVGQGKNVDNANIADIAVIAENGFSNHQKRS
jgi:hypothetical protein